jgi:hypothetical protein
MSNTANTERTQAWHGIWDETVADLGGTPCLGGCVVTAERTARQQDADCGAAGDSKKGGVQCIAFDWSASGAEKKKGGGVRADAGVSPTPPPPPPHHLLHTEMWNQTGSEC